ncbi:hypothetical protein [Polaromonas sp.]|uniref:hypothetical protein n=1 Tax=Polaromonas sp. TaxID=1869339 RepID=UPI00345D1E99
MREGAVFALLAAAALGSGVVAGIFFAFSSFVMSALGRLPPAQGVAAMQSINETVINPGFLLVFFGTGLACLALAGGAYFWWGETSAKLMAEAARFTWSAAWA